MICFLFLFQYLSNIWDFINTAAFKRGNMALPLRNNTLIVKSAKKEANDKKNHYEKQRLIDILSMIS